MNNTRNIIAAITIATAATAATADVVNVVDMKFTGTGSGAGVKLHMNDSTMNVFAGELEHEISNATNTNTFLNGTLHTYCADITESVTREIAQYNVTGIESVPMTTQESAPMSSAKSSAIRALYSTTFESVHNRTFNNALAAAFQITIWEIVNDYTGDINTIDITAGSLAFTNMQGEDLDQDIATGIEAFKVKIAAGLDNNQGGFAGVIGLANAGAQDQLTTVPAPGALALLSAGGLLISRRRRA